MYILKNAYISITRNKGRNILLGIIILVIGCATTVTLAIRSSADKLIESYNNKYEIEATITTNRKNMMGNFRKDDTTELTDEERQEKMSEMNEQFTSISNITIDNIKDYADSKYVKSYYYTASLFLNSSNVEKVSSSFGNKSNEENSGRKIPNMENNTSSDFTLMGYDSLSSMTEFIEGNYKITEGEISNDFKSNTCIINSELATLNNLTVGSIITLEDPNNESNTYDLIVVGIYEDSSEVANKEMSMFSNSANTIITNIEVINNIALLDDSLKITNNPKFILTSDKEIDKFTSELTEKGLSEYLTISTNVETIKSATSSISNLKSYATTFLVITLIIGGIVLLVVNSINIRERRYEIGVLRTIGMKKRLLTFQFTVELLAVTIIALSFGAIIGSISSVSISNKLLESEINSSKEQINDIGSNFGKSGDNNKNFDMKKMNGITSIQAYDAIDAVVDIKVLFKLFGIGILLTLISSISSMISIQKFSPLQILKERS